MATKIYGQSDDLVELEGDLTGEVSCFRSAGDCGELVVLSDGTILNIQYGKPGKAIWKVDLLEKGSLFDRIEICTDEDGKPYSDVAHFKDGLNWAYSAGRWERVK